MRLLFNELFNSYLKTLPVIVFNNVISSFEAVTFSVIFLTDLAPSSGAEMKKLFLFPFVLSKNWLSSKVRADTFSGSKSGFGGSGLYHTCSLRALKKKGLNKGI